MNVQVVRLPHSQVSLDIEADSALVGSAIDRAYQRLSQKYTVPGFRKGRAPRQVLDAAIGRSAVLDEAAEIAIDEAYRWALTETGLEPITNPDIDLQGDKFDPSRPLFFTAKFYVRPEVQLGDYTTIRVVPPRTEITDEDVERIITRMAENAAPWEPVEERAADLGDLAVLKMVGTVDDEKVIDSDGEEQFLNPQGTDDDTVPDLTPHIVGMRVGDTRDFSLDLPAGFTPEQYAGKTMQSHVELLRLEHKTPPVIDDAFAQSVGDYESLDNLRARVRQSLESQQRLSDAETFVAEVSREVVDTAAVDIPPPMVEDEIHRTLDNLKAEVESRRQLTMDLYLRLVGKTMEQLHEDARGPAEARAKSNLVLEAVATAENIEAPRQDVDAELREVASLPTLKERDRRRILTSPNVRARVEMRLKRRLALQRLLQIANPTDESADNGTSKGAADQRVLQEAAQSHADALEDAIEDPGEEET